MAIGAQASPSLPSRVSSRANQSVRLYLIENCRGRSSRKAPIPSRFPILSKRYRSSLGEHRPQLANNVRTGGICTLITP